MSEDAVIVLDTDAMLDECPLCDELICDDQPIVIQHFGKHSISKVGALRSSTPIVGISGPGDRNDESKLAQRTAGVTHLSRYLR